MTQEVEVELLLAGVRSRRRDHLAWLSVLSISAQDVARVIGPLCGRVGEERLVRVVEELGLKANEQVGVVGHHIAGVARRCCFCSAVHEGATACVIGGKR